MTEDADVDAVGELPDGVAAALARAETWAELPVGLEDAVVAAIGSGTGRDDRPERHRSLPWWLAAAAALVVVVAGALLVSRSGAGDDDEVVAVALAATELAPDASATARFQATPAGLRIVLEAENLPPAPDDAVYEAWIANDDLRVSCGSFHLRDGSQPISLWAGVDDPSFDTLTVTREPLDGETDTSGQVLLRGEFEMPVRDRP